MVKSLRLGIFFILISLSFFLFIKSNENFVPVFTQLDHPPWLEERLTNYFQQPVHIGDSHFYWKGLFHPSLIINNFSIDTPNEVQCLHIDKLSFGIDILGSFFKRRWVPGDVTVEGAKFIVQDKGNGLIDINGIPSLQADLSSTHSEKFDALIDMILSDGTKSIKNVDLIWYDQNGKLILPLTQINISGHSYAFLRWFSGTAKLWQGTPVSFAGNIYGTYFTKKILYTTLNAKINHLNLASNPLLQQMIKRFSFIKGNADLQVGLLAKPNHDFSFTGTVNSGQVQIIDNKTSKTYPQAQVVSQYHLHLKQNNLSVGLKNLQLSLQGKLLPIHAVTIEKITSAVSHKLRIRFDLFPIQRMINFMRDYQLLSPKLIGLVNETQPTGYIKDFVLQLENQKAEQDKKVSFSGYLRKISFNPYERFPGVTNLSGRINFSPTSGNFLLRSDNWILNLPRVFRSTLQIQKSDAEVVWNFNKLTQEWQINIKEYRATTPEGSVLGYMKILLPKNHTNPEIESKATFSVTSLLNASKYYPYTIMPKPVIAWLDNSIKQGQLAKGIFILKGKMKDFPFDNNKGQFLISADLTNGRLHYKDNWPQVNHLSAKLLFKGRSMAITASNAEILDAKVNNVTANIQNLEKALLLIHGQLVTSKNQNIKVDQHNNPLVQHTSFLPFKAFTVQGPLQVAINLSLPLSQKLGLQPQYQGDVLFNKVNINSLTSELSLQNLAGHFYFANNEGHTQLLTGQLQAHPFKMIMNTNHQINGDQISEMNLDSSFSMLELQKFFKINSLDAVTGTTAYHANLKIVHAKAADHNQMNLTINSNLKGLQSNLPGPLTKAADLSWPSNFNFVYSNKLSELSFTLAQQLNGVISFKDQSLVKGNIHFGTQQAKLPVDQGLLINGEIQQFDWSLWKKYFQANSSNKKLSDKVWLKYFPKLDLDFKTIKIGDFTFSPLKLIANKANNMICAAIDSPLLKGQIDISSEPNQPIRANIKELTIPEDQQIESELNPQDVPALDLLIGNLHYHAKFIQNISLRVIPLGHDLLIKQLQINEPIFRIDATGIWRKTNDVHKTSLSGNFYSNNLGAFLNQWHVTDNVVKGQGSTKFNLSWLNSPINPELKSLQGSMNLHFSQGRIIKLGTQVDFGMGIGRMLNLLSLQTIPRRLKGDFSDLTESGFSFDELNGLLQFRQGNVYTENSVLDGTVGKVKIKGRIGLVQKDYNLRLKINPNVTSSLPIVATITAGPIAGLATWVADKVFSHQVKQMTEIHYNVTGTWDNPKLSNVN